MKHSIDSPGSSRKNLKIYLFIAIFGLSIGASIGFGKTVPDSMAQKHSFAELWVMYLAGWIFMAAFLRLLGILKTTQGKKRITILAACHLLMMPIGWGMYHLITKITG